MPLCWIILGFFFLAHQQLEMHEKDLIDLASKHSMHEFVFIPVLSPYLAVKKYFLFAFTSKNYISQPRNTPNSILRKIISTFLSSSKNLKVIQSDNLMQ